LSRGGGGGGNYIDVVLVSTFLSVSSTLSSDENTIFFPRLPFPGICLLFRLSRGNVHLMPCYAKRSTTRIRGASPRKIATDPRAEALRALASLLRGWF